MGEIHKASLEGVKLEGKCNENAFILSILFGPYFVFWVAFEQKDPAKKSAIMKAAICMWFAAKLCCVGWIWAIKWAQAAKAQS